MDDHQPAEGAQLRRDPDGARARRVLPPQVRGRRRRTTAPRLRQGRARPRRSSPSRRPTPTSTSTCRRRRTGRSCSPSACRSSPTASSSTAARSSSVARSCCWRCSAGRSSRSVADEADYDPPAADGGAEQGAGRPLADVVVDTPTAPTRPGTTSPTRARRSRPDDHGACTSRSHRAVQQQAGDVAVPRQRVPAVRRPDLHLHAVPRPPLRRTSAPTRSTTSRSRRSSSFVLLMSSLTMVLAVSAPRSARTTATPSCGSPSPRCSAPRSSAARCTSSRPSTARVSASRRACSARASTRSPASTASTSRVGIIMLLALVGMISREQGARRQGRGGRAGRPVLALRRHRLDRHLHPRLPDPGLRSHRMSTDHPDTHDHAAPRRTRRRRRRRRRHHGARADELLHHGRPDPRRASPRSRVDAQLRSTSAPLVPAGCC